MGQNKTLSPNQRRAIAALLSEPNVSRAAEAAKVARSTLYRYLGDPEFVSELRRHQDAILVGVTSALIGLSGGVLETLQTILADEKVSAGTRVRAALGWLDQARKSIELNEILARLKALEEVYCNDKN